jgi:hypothetical protein
MARTYQPKTMLNKLQFSPSVNPLVNPDEIQIKRRKVRSGHERSLVDTATGEVSHVNAVLTIEEKDDAEFVKVFADGIKAAYQLTQTGARVFQAVLLVYQSAAMKGGFAEAIELYWFGGELSGTDPDMSEYTYKQGLRELIDKRFLAPRIGSTFWVNPSLFFKGNRVRFIQEYVRVQNGGTRTRRGRPTVVPKAVADESAHSVSALEPSIASQLQPVPIESEHASFNAEYAR